MHNASRGPFSCLLALGLVACGPPVTIGSDLPVDPPVSGKRVSITDDLRAVWGSSAHDVWAVGASGAIRHFDGRTWAVVDNGGITEDLSSVHGTGPNDVWATGLDGTVMHWNGEAWSVADSPADGSMLLGVWTGAPSDVWAVGIDMGGYGFFRHWDGATWKHGGALNPSSLWKVWGSGPNDVWMVGGNSSDEGVILRGDTTGFAAFPFDGPGLRGVWGSGPNDVWVAPYQGEIEHWDGTTWTRAPSSTAVGSLLGLRGVAPNELWAVGLDGLILHYVGSEWSQSSSSTANVLWSVWGSTPNDVWAVGKDALLYWNGSAWSP
jgi:hypothetical protein